MEKTDQYCYKILCMLLLIEGLRDKGIRFNELHRALLNREIKISRPTLIHHLEHLTSRKYVIRNEEDKQNVTYRLSLDKFMTLKENKKFLTEEIKRELREEKSFKSTTIESQIAFTSVLLSIGELMFMKLSVLDIIDPKEKLQHELEYTMIRDIYNSYNKWLIDTCKESKENASKTLEILNKRITEMEKPLLEEKM